MAEEDGGEKEGADGGQRAAEADVKGGAGRTSAGMSGISIG